MRTNHILTLFGCSLFLMTSCSKLGKLSADNFSVTPNPLEVTGGKVTATVEGQFPEKYMNKKATVTVVPELHYAGGQVAKGQPMTFQGEKVMGNNKTISYRLGGRYTMKTTFDYVPAMQKSDMYLVFDAYLGKSKVEVPAVKVATGVIATAELYREAIRHEGACLALDSFQRVLDKKQEANVKFLINQANLRSSELKNNSVQEFVSMLKRINADREKLAIKNVEVQAYASPEGGFAFNDKLAGKRQDVSEGYVKQQLKGTKLKTDIDAHYTAQDWEGFMKLVKASNIQDKDVILRVLSMYKDPQEREQQIRNMSEAFRELADGILPELRRSRLIINYQVVGRSDEQIQQAFRAEYTGAALAGRPAGAGLEGYIYGETYSISSDASAQQVLQRAVTHFSQIVTKYDLERKFASRGLTLYQGITLASIVQKESKGCGAGVTVCEDQRQIASVFYNRLKKDIPLGSDVTYHYAADKAGVARDHTLNSPYNTRLHKGLPPGPIAVPGLSALNAVADPATTDNLYFISGDDDVTYFGKTEADHQANVKAHCAKKCLLP